MKSKSLESLLARESGLQSDMVTRFQTLRNFGQLSRARGRNAEMLDTHEIVACILATVADKPGMAATTAIGLGKLMPVGLAEDAFAGAPTLMLALAVMIDNQEVLSRVIEIRLGDSDPINGMATSASIVHEKDGFEIETQYVPSTAVSLFRKGMEKEFDRRELGHGVVRETVILPRLIDKIVNERICDQRLEAAMGQ